MHARTSQDALRTLTDAAGQRHVPAGPDARIVSLVPSLTELVFDLGLGDRLVGRTGFCVHPREALRGVPKVGGTKDVKLERIRELAPTHVLVNMDENRRETVDALAAFVPDIVDTYIAATLAEVGWYTVPAVEGGETGAARYPAFDWEAPWLADVARVLLSTEPYRFRAEHLPEVESLARRPALLVDGEMVSWYGSRAARGLRWLMALRRGMA